MTGQPYPNTPADATTGDLAAALVSAGASQSINQKLLGCPSARACLKSKTPLLDTSRRSRWAATDQWLAANPGALTKGSAPAPAPAPIAPPAATAPAASAPAPITAVLGNSPKPKAPVIQFDAIPPELQAGRFLVMWRFVLKKDKHGKPKWTKPPYQINGQFASTTNPATWCTMAEAKAALAARNPDGSPMFDGIGRVLSPDDPVAKFGFDLDHCIALNANGERKLSVEAQQAIKELACYAELSPSGEGVHVIGLGKLPGPHFTNNKLGREAYDSTKAGRYLTMTGHVLPGFETLRAPDPAALGRWYAQWDTHSQAGQSNTAAASASTGATGTAIPPAPAATAGGRSGAAAGAPGVGAAAASSASNPQPIQFLNNVALDSRGLPQDIIDLIRRQDGLDRHYNSDGSLAVYAACIEMARAGFSDLEMLSVLTDSTNALADVALRRRRQNRQSAAQWLLKYQLGQARGAVAKGITSASLQGKADHFSTAMAFLDRIEAETGHRPVYSRGSFWTVEGNLWSAMSLEKAAATVGRHFGGRKNVMKAFDFKAIATLAATIVEETDFFDLAPAGVAGPALYWRVEAGKVVSEPLTPDHRQRMRLPTDPVVGKPPAKLLKVLRDAMGSDARGQEQIELLRLCLGAALIGTLWKYRSVLCLKGPTTAGKSVVLNVFAALFPKDMVGATSPARWESEYFVAALAGRRLNIVGELDAHAPIPSGVFKAVVGGDVIEGRHPTHRPFDFVCLAAHVFNCNRLPPASDRSDAFFIRWRVVAFEKSCPPGQVIVGLAEQIVTTELAEVAGWLLEGAAALTATTLPTSTVHNEEVERWRNANNSAAAFALDSTWCRRGPDALTPGDGLYRAYEAYTKDTGQKQFGRTSFYENLMERGSALGIARIEKDHAVWFTGVELVPERARVFGVVKTNAAVQPPQGL